MKIKETETQMKERPVISEALKQEVRKYLSPVNLASQSANRIETLRSCSAEVHSFAQNIDEEYRGLKDSGEIVRHIASAKLDSFMNSPDFDSSVLSLALDTMVSFRGKMLGKASDAESARAMLLSFSAERQDVVTGYALFVPGQGILTGSEHSSVFFNPLSPDDVSDYLALGEWIGVAGSYRIQKNGWKLIDRIEGSWLNVVGLPLEKLVSLLSSLH